jgi:type II secretory pathway component PulK
MITQRQGSHLSGRSGSVLILSLWVVFFLAALAVAIGSHVSTVFGGAERLSARVKARAAAVAGAAQAAGVVMAQTNAWDGLSASAWNRDESLFKAIEMADGRTFSVVFARPDGEGTIVTNYGIIGEEAKINLNTSHTNLLSALFEVAGGMSQADAEALSVEVSAWRSADDDERLTAGATSGYSAQTRPDEEEALRRLLHIEDLLEIEGVDAALVERLRSVVTVFGVDLVNINAASPVVLEVLGTAVASEDRREALSSLVRKLVGFRDDGKAFDQADYTAMRKSLDQYAALTGEEGSVFTAMASLLTVRSTAFSGTAFGTVDEDSPLLQVDFVWDTQARRYVMWRER